MFRGRRVVVTGLSGSGKSTFSSSLAGKTGLPLIHLDLEFWKPGWVAPTDDEMPEGCPDSAWRRLRDEWAVAGRVLRKRRWEPEREREIISQFGGHTEVHVLRSATATNEFLDHVGSRRASGGVA